MRDVCDFKNCIQILQKLASYFKIYYQELLSQLQMPVLLVCRYCSHTAYNVLCRIVQFVLNMSFILPALNALVCMHSFEDMNLKWQQLHKALL